MNRDLLKDSSFDIHWIQWQFVESPSDGDFCSLCKKVLKEPMLTECCGAHLCSPCASPNMVKNKLIKCPNCDQRCVICILNKAKHKAVLRLKVHCPIQNRGCEWIGEIKESSEHLNSECEFMDVICSNGCGESILRQELTEHLEKFCMKRQVICNFCKERGDSEIIIGDHILKCPNYPIVCPLGCGEQFQRAHTEQHMEECVLVTVPCSYQFAGCDVILAKQFMAEHFYKNTVLHSQLLSVYVTKRLETTSVELQEQEDVRERLFEYHDELGKINTCNLEMSNEQLLEQVTLEGLKKLENRVKTIKQKVTELRHRLAQPYEHLEHTVRELISQLPNMLWELNPKALQFEARLVSGQFNEVWKGLQYENRQVAIKKHKPGTMTLSKFFHEALILKKLDHNNIIKVIGVSKNQGQTLIVTKLMVLKSLFHIFKDNVEEVLLDQQINIAEQVISGMAYLEGLKCVHRAVNCRSVLVGESFECKIGSFSLAKILKEDEYESRIPQGERVPIKWSAPEVLIHSKCSLKSDVWCFGILLYEIMACKVLKMSDTKAEAFIKDGTIPECPPRCSKEKHDIIVQCLSFTPDSRPTFSSLLEIIQKM